MNQRVDDNWPTDGNDPDPSKDNRSYRGYSYKTGYGYGYGGYDFLGYGFWDLDGPCWAILGLPGLRLNSLDPAPRRSKVSKMW